MLGLLLGQLVAVTVGAYRSSLPTPEVHHLEPDAVTLEIDAPPGAGPTFDGIEWIVRAAGRPSVA